MRFRFCGGLEPPDWLLAEIPLLAALDDAKAAALSSDVCRMTDEESDTTGASLGLYEHAQDARAVVALLRFVLTQSAKYDVDDRDLAMELQQLGVGSDIAQSIARVYGLERSAIRHKLQAKSFKFPTIEHLRWRVDDDRRVEMRLQLDKTPLACDTASIQCRTPQDTLNLAMSEDKFLALYEELSQANSIIQSLKR